MTALEPRQDRLDWRSDIRILLRRASRISVLAGPAVLWLLILFALPIAAMVGLTFHTGTFGPGSDHFTLAHYDQFLANTSYHRLLLRSLWIAFLVALWSILLSYPVAYFLAFRAGKLQATLLTILIVPAWTSFLLRVLAWRVILGSNGVLNSFLRWLGLTDRALPVLLYSRTAVIVTLVYVWVPFAALPIFVALQRIERNLLESASDLGATPWRAFLRITLPLSLPGVLAAFLFVFIPTVGEYVTPGLVGGPDSVMYGNIVWDQFARALNWPMGSIMSLAMLVIVLLPLAIFSRFLRFTDLAGM